MLHGQLEIERILPAGCYIIIALAAKATLCKTLHKTIKYIIFKYNLWYVRLTCDIGALYI